MVNMHKKNNNKLYHLKYKFLQYIYLYIRQYIIGYDNNACSMPGTNG